MSRTLMMMSGLAARMPMFRFPFACAALAVIAACAYAFVPWAGVWGWMLDGPDEAEGVLEFFACIAVWVWAIACIIATGIGLVLTLSGEFALSEYPVWWGVWTVERNTKERYVEVWRVLAWLPFVPCDIAGFALLPVYGLIKLLIKLLKYPWRLLATAATFDLSRLGRGG